MSVIWQKILFFVTKIVGFCIGVVVGMPIFGPLLGLLPTRFAFNSLNWWFALVTLATLLGLCGLWIVEQLWKAGAVNIARNKAKPFSDTIYTEAPYDGTAVD
jgi:uncharacterized membrane protein required for colicin V production